MKKSRKIDEIYREKLRNVESPPPADSFDYIFARLPEKNQKRRILPLWYKLAGVAAALILFVTLFDFSSLEENDSQITTAPVQTPSNPLEINPVSNAYKEAMLRSSIILEALRMGGNEPVARVNEEENIPLNESTRHFAGLVENSEASERSNTNTGFTLPNPSGTEVNTPETDLQSSYSFLDYIDSDPALSGKSTEETSIAEVKAEEKNAVNNPLVAPEEELNKEVKEKSGLNRRFSITTTAAAVYFDNLGGGNVLDNQFANREGSGEISMAYGINLAYQLSEKVKLRTGVSKVNLSHNTEDVGYASAANSSAIEGETLSLAFSRTGNLNQHLGFIEVPLEMEYALIDKKIGLSLIGGASTLFLNENEVSLNSQNSTTTLGEAGNLNNVSFSTNIGIGINYNLTPQFQLNLEPIFKYQLNTFDNSPGLNPYYFGIYSGLNFKF